MRLENKSFVLGSEPKDVARRRLFFRGEKGIVLTQDELNILKSIGVDAELQKILRPYLAQFFEALPDCQSDVSIGLSSACEVPYYVLWAVDFANRFRTKQKVDEQPDGDHPEPSRAEDISVVKQLNDRSPKPTTIERLFTLTPVSLGSASSDPKPGSGSEPGSEPGSKPGSKPGSGSTGSARRKKLPKPSGCVLLPFPSGSGSGSRPRSPGSPAGSRSASGSPAGSRSSSPSVNAERLFTLIHV